MTPILGNVLGPLENMEPLLNMPLWSHECFLTTGFKRSFNKIQLFAEPTVPNDSCSDFLQLKFHLDIYIFLFMFFDPHESHGLLLQHSGDYMGAGVQIWVCYVQNKHPASHCTIALAHGLTLTFIYFVCLDKHSILTIHSDITNQFMVPFNCILLNYLFYVK